MGRRDWTPAVLATATAALTVVLVVWLLNPWLVRGFRDVPGPARARRNLQPTVDVWVGELAPGLKGLLGAVWGDRGSDEAHDATLNDRLALEGDRALAYYQLLLFNTGEEERTVVLRDGALTILAPDGERVLVLRSLAGLVASGEVVPPPSLRRVLESLGTLRESITVPPGRMADLLVAFDGRVDLEEAQGVLGADGTAFHRRRMSRRELESLITRPDAARVGDL